MKTELTVALCLLFSASGLAQAQEVSVAADSASQVSRSGPPPQAVTPPTPAPEQQPPAPRLSRRRGCKARPVAGSIGSWGSAGGSRRPVGVYE